MAPAKNKSKKGQRHAKIKSRRELAGEGWMSLASACELFRKHNVPGYGNRESARKRIVIDKTMPIQRFGKQYFVPIAEVHKLTGSQPVVLDKSEDQALLEFYQTDPSNDYIKATTLGLSRTLSHAKYIFDSYQVALTDPRIRQAVAEKKQAEERKRLEEERVAAPTRKCEECDRTPSESRTDSAEIVYALTGVRKPFFDVSTEFVVLEFISHRCSKCLAWRKTAPIAAMRAKIEQLEHDVISTGPADEAPTEVASIFSSNSSGSRAGPSGRTSDGSMSADGGAGAEEALPLPTTRD